MYKTPKPMDCPCIPQIYIEIIMSILEFEHISSLLDGHLYRGTRSFIIPVVVFVPCINLIYTASCGYHCRTLTGKTQM